jgi:hypothetical protein
LLLALRRIERCLEDINVLRNDIANRTSLCRDFEVGEIFMEGGAEGFIVWGLGRVCFIFMSACGVRLLSTDIKADDSFCLWYRLNESGSLVTLRKSRDWQRVQSDILSFFENVYV